MCEGSGVIAAACIEATAAQSQSETAIVQLQKQKNTAPDWKKVQGRI
jgi:hypothetical protein